MVALSQSNLAIAVVWQRQIYILCLTFELNGVSYTTQELYLDTNGSTLWTVQAEFDIPNFGEIFDGFLEAVTKGEIILRLGDYRFVSNKEENWELFD